MKSSVTARKACLEGGCKGNYFGEQVRYVPGYEMW
jgi:hypothetical protein